MDDFDISARTFDRYICELRNLGFEIPRASNGYYWIDRKLSRSELADLIYINDEELLILSQAVEAIDEGNALKADLRKKMRALLDPTLITNSILHPERARMVKLLGIAIEKKNQVIVGKYRSGHSNIIRDRKVEPISLSSNFQMLTAFDPEDRTTKQYKIARMESVKIIPVSFQFEEMHSFLQTDPFRISGSEPRQIKFRMSLIAYNLLKEEYPLSEAFVHPFNDDIWEFSGTVYGNKGIGRFILSLPGETEVIEDLELKAYLQNAIGKFGRKLS